MNPLALTDFNLMAARGGFGRASRASGRPKAIGAGSSWPFDLQAWRGLCRCHSTLMPMGRSMAKAAGIVSADHIAINETGKRQQDGSQIAAGTLLFVVQGQAPSDPAARRSMTDVAQAVECPVEQSLQKVDALTQLLAQQKNQPSQDELVRTQRMV
jgi:hypothetical protein